MGVWGTGLSSNDTFADVYEEFFDLYNDGISVKEITDKLIKNHQQTINDLEDDNNFWFALAKAQWECKALEPQIFTKVKQIIHSGSDLQIWKDSEATDSDLKKREKVLNDFLTKISVEKPKARARRKKKLYDSIFKKGDCLVYLMENGKYGGAFVLSDEKQTYIGGNIIAITTIEKDEKPILIDFKQAEILVRRLKQPIYKSNELQLQWIEKEQVAHFCASTFQSDLKIEVIGNLKIYHNYILKNNLFVAFPWNALLTKIPNKKNYENENGIPKIKLYLSKFIKKPWYKF